MRTPRVNLARAITSVSIEPCYPGCTVTRNDRETRCRSPEFQREEINRRLRCADDDLPGVADNCRCCQLDLPCREDPSDRRDNRILERLRCGWIFRALLRNCICEASCCPRPARGGFRPKARRLFAGSPGPTRRKSTDTTYAACHQRGDRKRSWTSLSAGRFSCPQNSDISLLTI